MKNNNWMIVAGLLAGGIAAQAHAGCYDLKGVVHTTSLSQTAQLGTIDLVGSLGEFEGAISGQVTSSDMSTFPMTSLLDHVVAIPGKGTLFTHDDAAQIMPIAGDACNLQVTEALNIVGGSKKFNGAQGSGTASGTINLCNGENKFFIEVNICTTP